MENAKLLSKYFVSFLKFRNLHKTKNDDLLNIDRIGETQISSIKGFFVNEINLKVLDELGKILYIKNFIATNQNGSLKNKSLVTGKLNGISRAEVKSLIEENQNYCKYCLK